MLTEFAPLILRECDLNAQGIHGTSLERLSPQRTFIVKASTSVNQKILQIQQIQLMQKLLSLRERSYKDRQGKLMCVI